MIEAVVLSLALVLLRVASFVMFLPPFSTGGLPSTVKIGLAIALTAVWGPLYAPLLVPQLALASLHTHPELQIGWMAGREVVIGVALAWVLGLLFVPMKIAGAYIAQEMGLTMGSLASPVDQQSSNVVSQFTESLGTLVFFAMDAQHLLFRAFASLLQAVPLGHTTDLPGRDWVVGCVAGAERTGLELAAPVGAGLFLAMLLLLLLMRTAPQFNLMTFGMQVRLVVGLVLLGMLTPEFIQRVGATFQRLAEF